MLEHDGKRFGALALLPARGPGTLLDWMSSVLASQAASTIARARARLQHAVLLRDDVFVAAAHELGNSLRALALQVRAMLDEASVRSSDSPFAPHLDTMDFQVSRLIALNRRMLDSARPGLGRIPAQTGDRPSTPPRWCGKRSRATPTSSPGGAARSTSLIRVP